MGRYYTDPDGIEDALDDIDKRLEALECGSGGFTPEDGAANAIDDFLAGLLSVRDVRDSDVAAWRGRLLEIIEGFGGRAVREAPPLADGIDAQPDFSPEELENLDVLLSIFSDGEAREMAQRLREKLPVKAERDQARTEPGVPAWVAILAVAAAEMRRDQSIFPDPMPEKPASAPGAAWRQLADQIERALRLARGEAKELEA